MPYFDGINGAAPLFVTPQSVNKSSGRYSSGGATWYEALAQAWGQVLDNKAGELVASSNDIGNNGVNNPSAILKASALAQEFNFLSSQAATATNSIADGLQSVAKRS